MCTLRFEKNCEEVDMQKYAINIFQIDDQAGLDHDRTLTYLSGVLVPTA